MAFSVIQSGIQLYFLSDSGVKTGPLTLPNNVTLRSDVPPRFIKKDGYVILVNTPSEPLLIASDSSVNVLAPKPPRLAAVLSGTAGGALSGTYGGVRYTFLVQDALGNIISESDFSPASNTVTISTQYLTASGLDISPDTITGRRLYRPTSNGATLFQWVDLDGNVLTSVSDDLPDAELDLVAAPILGSPPHLSLIAEFRGRLFGVGTDDVHHLRYTEAGIRYAWPVDNLLEIPILGSDNLGIMGLAPRRESLGVGKQNQFIQITGTGAETPDGGIDFNVVVLSRECGIESQESVAIYRDIAYFLWKDGVYQWDSGGLTCISDGAPSGRGNVRSWFTTDSYFNRSRFKNSFGIVDPVRNKYRLFLATVGSNVENTWVEFDLQDRTWWGPHNTAAFSPTCAFFISGVSNQQIPSIGSQLGNIYQEQLTRTDDTAVAINFDVITKRHDGGAPDLDKYFGELSMFGKTQPAGTLNIAISVGELNATVTQNQTYDMTKNRSRQPRVGTGKHVQFEFTNNQVAQDVELYGYTVDPVNILGRR